MSDSALLLLVAFSTFCFGMVAGIRLCAGLDRKCRDEIAWIKHESMLSDILRRVSQ